MRGALGKEGHKVLKSDGKAYKPWALCQKVLQFPAMRRAVFVLGLGGKKIERAIREMARTQRR
jgi:hypothetical protein